MKFDMGAQTLTQLIQRTSTAGQDLGTLVRRLAEAAEPLEGKFNGQGRAQFDLFKSRTDQIANELDAALAAVLGGVKGQEQAFSQGDTQMADSSQSAQSSIDFDAAKFSAR
ncbi:MAG: hypothetical protein LBI84_01080 [Propionibacteriaceae bacterium]|jgi:uncharacterized protein YukE|nr:hypothetical protein [Propionibacteriaceae bacterium]